MTFWETTVARYKSHSPDYFKKISKWSKTMAVALGGFMLYAAGQPGLMAFLVRFHLDIIFPIIIGMNAGAVAVTSVTTNDVKNVDPTSQKTTT